MRGIALRLEGPMQSWGGPIAGDARTTLDHPTKSGVLGIVAAGLGIPRDAVDQIAALHRGLQLVVRVDQPGQRGVDYHTVLPERADMARATDEKRVQPTLTARHHLYDASFLALLIERDGLDPPLEVLIHGLRYPRYALYLGRRACVPSRPLLAVATVIEGARWQDLLTVVDTLETHRPVGGDVFVEGDEAGALAHRRLRDVVIGPRRRLFDERVVSHMRAPAAVPVPVTRDTVDRWMP